MNDVITPGYMDLARWGSTQAGGTAAELRMPNAFEIYPLDMEPESMHCLVRDGKIIPTARRFHHLATVYDHNPKSFCRYMDGRLTDAITRQRLENETHKYRAVEEFGHA